MEVFTEEKWRYSVLKWMSITQAILDGDPNRALTLEGEKCWHCRCFRCWGCPLGPEWARVCANNRPEKEIIPYWGVCDLLLLNHHNPGIARGKPLDMAVCYANQLLEAIVVDGRKRGYCYE